MLGLAPRIPLPIQACAEETDNRHGQREHQRSDLAKIHLHTFLGDAQPFCSIAQSL
jgi:hypothetical protein